MDHPPILILGNSEAAMLLRRGGGADLPVPVGAVLSIHGTQEPALDAAPVAHHLVLRFDDADVPDPADPVDRYRQWARRKWAAEIGRPLVPPTVDDVRAILGFANATRGIQGAVLFQCHGGCSRSPAAALISLAAWTGPGREAFCAEAVLRVRPGAAPHVGLVRLADALLGRDGRLVQAELDARRDTTGGQRHPRP